MPTRAEVLFERFQKLPTIKALVGKAEDADFDCKVWRGKGQAGNSIAKAACGFTNATGGVILIGVEAKGQGPNLPDVVNSLQPVADVHAVTSDALDIILNQVEPGIEGIQTAVVLSRGKGKAGYVLLYIPATDGSPRRAKFDNNFYVRIASGTLPMAYFQVDDRFGRRPHARLVVEALFQETRTHPMSPNVRHRRFIFKVKNEGRGIARFPALRCRRGSLSLAQVMWESHAPFLWNPSEVDPEWFSFRGGANDVVYPGESLQVAILTQAALGGPQHLQRPEHQFGYPAITLKTEVVCDGMATHSQTFTFGALSE